MESRRPSFAPKILAAAGLLTALALSVALACVGCARSALPSEDDTGDSATQAEASAATTEFIAPEKQFVVEEATFTPPPSEPESEPEPKPLRHAVSNADILGLSADRGPFAFALAENDVAPALASDTGNDITYATSTFNEAGWKTGYLLVDLETGRGVAGGLDERVFGASAIKAPFVHYLCERWLDEGRINLDSTVGGSDVTVREAVEAAILKSDNDSYKLLFNAYSAEWGSWLKELGIAGEINAYQRNPYYTARESGVMWLEIHRYINAEGDNAGEHAAWFADLLASTQVSFMRHAIGGDGVSVLSKPGWYATPEGSEQNMDGFCESGIVSADGRDYLLVVMTNAAYKGSLEYPFEDIIQAVWAARTDIAMQ